ncbi:MAG: hypothetical protein OXI11_07735 [Gammaproteobacteria bacterium]|nr:hypothetical protein [Gammaproteobacteria bacterium]MXW45135.1 hypothetical protein [Gammaproteobacteria bacterium]MYD01891.1 hypothetical protein [Gammaproteobacteria bacterium]MYI26100.1 hypothetical protein [Gammaproteobacteria bacterium]
MTTARSIFLSGNTTKEEQEYFRLIDEIAGKQESRIISNGKPAHTIYLLYKFLHCARHKISICSGRLLQELPGKTDSVLAYADPALARAAIHFLGRENTELSIVVADKDGLDTKGEPQNHPFLKALVDAGAAIKGRVTVAASRNDPMEAFPYHFLVMDDTALRVEIDTESAEAYVNFNDPVLNERLQSLFHLFQEDSKPFFQFPLPA